MKRECSMLLLDGGRRVTRSHIGSSRKSIRENDGNTAKYMDNSGSDHHVPANDGVNAYSPTQVGPVSQHVVRKSTQESLKGRSSVKPERKLIKKNMGLNKSVFINGVLSDGVKLHYCYRGQKGLAGFIMAGGIYCSHCREVVSASAFEAHAGHGSRKKPYENIITTDGQSLHTLAIKKSKRTIAFDERNENTIVDGGIHVCDSLKETTQQGGIHIGETSMADIGGCAICSGHDFTEEAFDDRTMIICDQCELGYHISCLRVQMMSDLKALPKGKWFCCEQCKHINSHLQMYTEMEDLSIQDHLYIPGNKKKDGEQVLELNYKLDIKWKLINGRTVTEANKKFLSDVVSIFQDQFAPIADSTTAFVNLIPQMVFGNTFKDKDYGGIHCAILMVNSVVVSAAIFRVFGAEVAEFLLVATKRDCQRKGYFQLLFYSIVDLLASLNVKNLVLSTADESVWKNGFGFTKLDVQKVHDFKKWSQRLTLFEGTSIMHKPVIKL